MHLRLVDTEREPHGDPALGPPLYDFESQPVRPGAAYEAVSLVLDAGLADDVGQAAGCDGVPTEPWAALVVESSRALRALHDPPGLARRLDEMAAQYPAPAVHSASRSRLLVYAGAIRARSSSLTARPRESLTASTSLELPVPYNSVVSWAKAALEHELPLSRWIEEQLTPLPSGRPLWEAAAAEAGLALGEWISFYAASS